MRSSDVVFRMMSVAALLISAAAAGASFTDSFGNFIDNHAGGAGITFTPAKAEIDPEGTEAPQTVYLQDWTFAKSSSGFGAGVEAYLGVFSYDQQTGYGDLLGFSLEPVDMASFPTSYPGSLMTWEFEGVALDRDTEYALLFINFDGQGNWFLTGGGIELEVSGNYPWGGFIQYGYSTVNQPGWNAHFRATYSSSMLFPAFYVSHADEYLQVVRGVGGNTYTLQLLPDPNTLLPPAEQWPCSPVTVDIYADDEVSVYPASVVFPVWTGDPADYTVTITVTSDDDGTKGERIGQITHQSASLDERWNDRLIRDVQVSVVDRLAILDTGGSTTITNEAAEDTYQVILNGAPSHDVAVTALPAGDNIALVDLGNGPGQPITLVFPAGQSGTQTVTVSATESPISGGLRMVTVNHTTASADQDYHQQEIQDVEVSVIGDEPYCSQMGTLYLPGDLNRDCYVNMTDLAMLTSNWLECTDTSDPINCVNPY